MVSRSCSCSKLASHSLCASDSSGSESRMLLEIDGNESTSSSRSEEDCGAEGSTKDDDTEALDRVDIDMPDEDMLDADMSDMAGGAVDSFASGARDDGKGGRGFARLLQLSSVSGKAAGPAKLMGR